MVRAAKSNNKIIFSSANAPASKEYKREYADWQMGMYYHNGFNVSMGVIMDRLGVSRTWVHSVLNENVRFVQYSASFLQDIGETDASAFDTLDGISYIYYNCKELGRWLMDNSEFTVQTTVVDGKAFLGDDLTEVEVALFAKGIPISDTKIGGHNRLAETKVNAYIKLAERCDRDLVCDRKRPLFKAMKLQAFDFWNDGTIFFSVEQAIAKHPNYLKFVAAVAPSRITPDGRNIIPAGHKDADERPNNELDYEFIRRSAEAVGRMAFHLSLVKIHLKAGKARGKAFFAYLPSYRDLLCNVPELPVLVAADPNKHTELIPYFVECLWANSILKVPKAVPPTLPSQD